MKQSKKVSWTSSITAIVLVKHMKKLTMVFVFKPIIN